MIKTYRNTKFMDWYEAADAEFKRLGVETPTYGPARDAYEMGESPETWAAYVAGQVPA